MTLTEWKCRLRIAKVAMAFEMEQFLLTSIRYDAAGEAALEQIILRNLEIVDDTRVVDLFLNNAFSHTPGHA